MLPLGHLGIGKRLAAPWSRELPLWAVLLGTLLPDLIDKPLYYVPSLLSGKRGLALDPISGTRTFGHTLLLVVVVAIVAKVRRSAVLKAMVLGMLTHLLLDTITDYANPLFSAPAPPGIPSPIPGIAAVFWPLLGWQMPVALFGDLSEYASHSFSWFTISAEIVGGSLLLFDFLRHRKSAALRAEGAGRVR